MRVEVMDAATHDRILAVISHLPHVVAYALVNAAAQADAGLPGLLSYTGGGFRDFTRIAASHPAMWRDICLDNRDEVLRALDEFLAEAGRLRSLIAAGDGAGLESGLRRRPGRAPLARAGAAARRGAAVSARHARVRAAAALRGSVVVPGDKSISHRALILASQARGTTLISGLSRGGDVKNTARALRRLGVDLAPWGTEPLTVRGAGLGGWREPEGVLDFGNSGTGIRLMAGLLAAHPFFSVLSGDRYLRRRPMRRIAEPLRLMGARIAGRAAGTLAPLAIEGTRLSGIAYRSPVASAQVKSALLLAGLLADGETTVTEPERSRDHTERMLRFLGVDVRVDGTTVGLGPVREWDARDLSVPGDPSSAAFLVAAAVISPDGRDHRPQRLREPDAHRLLRDPARDGRQGAPRPAAGGLRRAGGRHHRRRSSRLRGIDVPPELVPQTIDEFPILAATALFARGTTRITGAAELRVKESDRISTMAAELVQARRARARAPRRPRDRGRPPAARRRPAPATATTASRCRWRSPAGRSPARPGSPTPRASRRASRSSGT